MHRAASLAALAALVAAGCGPGLTSKADRLEETVASFNENVRWQRFRAASRHLPPKRRQGWVAAMERSARSFKVTDYEVTPVETSDERAVVQVDLSYHLLHGVVVEKMRRHQEWRFAKGGWILTGDHEIPLDDPEVPDSAMPDWASPEADDVGVVDAEAP